MLLLIHLIRYLNTSKINFLLSPKIKMYQWATQEAATVQFIPNPSPYFSLKKNKISVLLPSPEQWENTAPVWRRSALQERPPRLQSHLVLSDLNNRSYSAWFCFKTLHKLRELRWQWRARVAEVLDLSKEVKDHTFLQQCLPQSLGQQDPDVWHRIWCKA